MNQLFGMLSPLFISVIFNLPAMESILNSHSSTLSTKTERFYTWFDKDFMQLRSGCHVLRGFCTF